VRPEREAIFRRLVPLVTGWCTRLGAGAIDAEAAASDALLVILRRLDDVDAGAPIEAYAWGVTTRVVREHRRRAWWRRWVPGVTVERAGRAADDSPEKRERVRLVHSVLAALDEGHREVIVLMDLEERAASEVAALMGVPEGTVRSRLRLARAAFRIEADRIGLGVQHLTEDILDA
jgi:RNA polymerase sigma-70 factor (ECF subfamily)